MNHEGHTIAEEATHQKEDIDCNNGSTQTNLPRIALLSLTIHETHRPFGKDIITASRIVRTSKMSNFSDLTQHAQLGKATELWSAQSTTSVKNTRTC
jgi:hypothetical protein